MTSTTELARPIPLTALAVELVDRPEFAVLSTRNLDGTIHQCVMWVGRDGHRLLLASRRGRPQVRNLLRDPEASLLVHDRVDPRRYVHVVGTVTISPDFGGAVIDRLSRAYVGAPHSSLDPARPDRDRIVVRLTPSRIHDHHGTS
jgi:PPOX class probable F420-dependent enzyme